MWDYGKGPSIVEGVVLNHGLLESLGPKPQTRNSKPETLKP